MGILEHCLVHVNKQNLVHAFCILRRLADMDLKKSPCDAVQRIVKYCEV